MASKSVLEEWKSIRGYDGKHEVSNLGNVRSTYHYKNVFCGNSRERKTIKKYEYKIIKPNNNGNGYEYVTFMVNGERKNFYVHRLVAEAFIDNPENLKYVNHKDYIRNNNNVSNLEWITQEMNVKHSLCNMYKFHSKVNSKSNERYIYMRGDKFRLCNKKLGIDKEFKTIKQAIKVRNKLLNEKISISR